MVFAFDPFFGYFSGTLYDTVIDAGTPLFTYRAGLARCTLAAVGAPCLGRVRPSRIGALRFVPCCGGSAPVRARVSRSALAAAAPATHGHLRRRARALGHWQTSATIAEALGGRRAGAALRRRLPRLARGTTRSTSSSADCEEELAHDERVLGTRFHGRITAFFFRDAGEKKRLMGAADTYIAKPWRREVYLQCAPYPHPVLGHELAHVVAGSFGRGPFRIAGARRAGGPNPGLIEGVAVAASPDDDELTDAQWARAMMDLGHPAADATGLLPRLPRRGVAKSYTLAGAFVRWVMERCGAEALRRWYGGEASSAAHGRVPGTRSTRSSARGSAGCTLAPETAAYAQGARFDRPSVFGRTCPHTVDALKREAQSCEDGHRIDRARALYDDVLAKDPHDTAARLREASMELRYGDHARGREALVAIAADPEVARTLRDRAEEAIADADLLAGRFEEAKARYQSVAARTLDEDAGRTLEVKALAATKLPAREAVEALLLGSEGRPADPWLGAFDSRRVEQRRRGRPLRIPRGSEPPEPRLLRARRSPPRSRAGDRGHSHTAHRPRDSSGKGPSPHARSGTWRRRGGSARSWTGRGARSPGAAAAARSGWTVSWLGALQ